MHPEIRTVIGNRPGPDKAIMREDVPMAYANPAVTPLSMMDDEEPENAWVVPLDQLNHQS